jgi:hypothetical protein
VLPDNNAVESSAGRPQLLLVKTELQSWLGKKYCEEADLLALLLAHSIGRCVHTIEVEVRPLGGDSFKVALDARRQLQGARRKQKSLACRAHERANRSYIKWRQCQMAEQCGKTMQSPSCWMMRIWNWELGDGEIVAMAVKTAFDPLHAKEERTLAGHTAAVRCIVVHADKLTSGSCDHTIKVWGS